VAAVLVSEGRAHFALLTPSRTLFRTRIETSIPRKRKGSVSAHDKGLEKFFEACLKAILNHINFEIIKCVIIAGPGFTKDQFHEYMMKEAQRNHIKVLLENQKKFLLCHASTGHKHGLKEVLSNESIASQLADTKAASEVRIINSFYDMLKKESDRAIYGLSHIKYALQHNAINDLLVTDSLFRSAKIDKRRLYVRIVEQVKTAGGDVHIFSSHHVSGEQLRLIGGIAAILRFPLPEIETEAEDEDEEDDESQAEPTTSFESNSNRGKPNPSSSSSSNNSVRIGVDDE